MISCPNKRLKAWKDLEAIYGENKAYGLWNKYEGYPPDYLYEVSNKPSAIPLISKDKNGKIIEDNTVLYKNYNLLNDKGGIKTVPNNEQTKKWLNTLNKSKYYSFYLRNTTGGLKILIYSKQQPPSQQTTLFSQSKELNNNIQGKQFQKLTQEEKAKTIEQITKEQNNSLFGLNTQNQEQLEFHINTLNVVSKFLENAGIETRLVSEFLSQDGSVVEGAIAAANFIEGTVDIIDDLNKGRVEAWNKLPEEAAHWWYRLLDTNSPLKKALWESHQTALKNDELYKTQYGKLVKSPADLTEESIGQLIAEAIKRIETKNANASDYSFFKKFLEWINSIIDVFKNTTQDPFEVAAMKILSSDMSDLMTWEEYRKLNNVVNFADVLTEQSVAPIDYTLIEDIGKVTGQQAFVDKEGSVWQYINGWLKNNKEIYSEVSNTGNTLTPRDIAAKAFNERNIDELHFIKSNGEISPAFKTKQELDNWVSVNIKEHDIRQKQQIQEVRDNQIFFDRLLNKTFRKKSKFLPKTLRKYFDIVDAQNLNPLREWNISQELQQITKKLSEQEKKQIIETNGYTNIAPTLKVLPDLLQKYKKNPIILSEPVKIDGAKKQELSILNGIKEMIKIENPNLKSITAEEFVAEAHNWLETNYLLGFANETSYLSYRTDQTFQYLSDRQSNEDVDITNLTEEEIQRLPLEERQRIANIVGLTKQNPDVYHNKVSLRFNDMYHLKSGHFDKSPSAWGNLTYFYTGKNKWKDAVLLHEIQNDNIEFLREFKTEKVDLETSLGRYLQQLNTNLLDNITQIESGGKKIFKRDSGEEFRKTHLQLNYQLLQLKDLPLEQGLSQLKQNLNERIELYKSDSSKNLEKAQEAVEKAYFQKRIFQDFKKRGGIKSLLTKEELEDLKNILHQLNTEEVEGEAQWLPDENQFEPGFPSIRNLKQKKADFKNKTIELQARITRELQKMYGDDAPLINLFAPGKARTKNQIRQGVRRNQELNENVNWLLAYSEKKILNNLSKTIEESKKNYIQARNATTANNFNVQLSKITLEQWSNLIENYKYNQDLLNRLIDEQAQKDIKSPQLEKIAKAKSIIKYLGDDSSIKLGTGKYGFIWDTADTDKGIVSVWDAYKAGNTDEDSYIDNWSVDEFLEYVKKVAPEYLTLDTKSIDIKNQEFKFNELKQKALDKKEELEKNYGKLEEEIKQTLEIEMNYFTPLVHHLIQKHINQYGKDFPMYFSGYNITKLTQGNDRTALIYAGKDEINIVDKKQFKINSDIYATDEGSYNKTNPLESFNYFKNNNVISQQEYEKAYQQATERRAKEIKFRAAKEIGLLNYSDFGFEMGYDYELQKLTDKQLEEGIKKLNEYKRQSKQNMDRVINTIMNISNNKPIETGAIYNAMTQISGVKLIWQDAIPGLRPSVTPQISTATGGYLVDLSNYNYNTPILYGLDTSKVVPINPNMVDNSEIQYSKKSDNQTKFSTFDKEEKQESAFTKQEIYFANRIKRLSEKLKKLEEGTTKYEDLKKELDILKEKFNTAKALQSTELFEELGQEVLDTISSFIDQLEDGTALDTAKSIEHAMDVINTFKDFGDLRNDSAKLLNRLKPFIDELKVEEVQEHATEKIKPTLKDIEAQDTDVSKRIGNTGSLSDLVNYVGRTIGSIIKSVQNKVETYTKKTKKEIEKEVKSLNDYAKKNGATLEDTYKLFVQESNGTLKLVQPFLDNGKQNPNWDTILNTPELLQFYNFYVTKIVEAQDGLPINFGKSFIPNVRKTDFKSKIKSLSIIKERTIKEGFEEDNLADVVPLEYHKSLPINEKSSDLGTILFEFDKYAYNHKEMSNILPKLRLLQESLTYKIVNGNYVERQFRTANNPSLTIPGNKTNLYNMINKVIDMQVKGNMKLDELQFVTSETTDVDGNTVQTVVDGSKALDLLLKFNSLLRIGLSPITSFTNWLFGDISNTIEAVGGQYFNLKQLHQASKIFFKQNFDRDSVMNKLLEELNPLQELMDYSLKSDIEQIGNTKLTTDKVQEIMYSMQTTGEKFLQSRTLLAVMINEGYLTSNGELTNEYNKIDSKKKQQLIDKVQRLNQKIHGRYSVKEAATLHQNVLFRLVSQFRKWIFTAVENRINQEQYDNRLQQTIEGSYRTFGRLVLKNWKNPKQAFENLLLPLINGKKLLEEDKLEEFEIYNMRKMAIELITIGSLAMLYAFVHGGDDDKDRRKLPLIKLILTLLDRASGDLTFFYSPEKINELGKNALPISKTLGDIIQAMYIVPKVLYTGDYTIKKGSSKGRNRIGKEFSDITPLAKPLFELYKIGRRDVSLEEQR